MVKSYQPEVIGQEERGRGPSLVQKNTDKTANDTGGMVVVNRGKVQNCGSATVSGEDGSNPRGPGEHATPSKQSMDVITIGNVADIVTEDPVVRKQLGRWDFVKHAPTILIAISMVLVGGEGASFKNIMTRVHRCEGAAVRGVATYRLRIEEKETSFALNQFQFADVAWASNQYDDTRPRYRLWHDATKAKTAGWAQCSGCDNRWDRNQGNSAISMGKEGPKMTFVGGLINPPTGPLVDVTLSSVQLDQGGYQNIACAARRLLHSEACKVTTTVDGPFTVNITTLGC